MTVIWKKSTLFVTQVNFFYKFLQKIVFIQYLQQHSFNMVDISLKESIKGFRIIGNTNLGHDSQRIVCTSRKVIELIKEILMAKCNVQMKGFKELFHYEGSFF